MPSISVIVPVYNVEKYLSCCMDSILNQTFRDFELILVDDGSTDTSGKICDEYAAKDGRIKVIHQANGGLSSARNAGIDIASGDYFTFIDSDDWVGTTYLNILYEKLIRHSADIAVVNYHKEFHDHREPAVQIPSGLYNRYECLALLYDPGMSIYLNIACAKLYRRELFDDIRYPIGRTHEDGFTTYKLLFKSKSIYLSDADLYYYYQRDNSIMNNTFSQNRIYEYYVYKERADFFKEHNLYHLFIKNEKTRLTCIKSLTVKILKSNFTSKRKHEFCKLFKSDIMQNFKYMMFGEPFVERLISLTFLLSCHLFVFLSNTSHFLKSLYSRH